ncbi:MAG TPA: ABC transporter substrate-binding protein [Balneolaceae bacterium]|nr:ABC transporter substrate-binding protein [Balneolaceae bacterium]
MKKQLRIYLAVSSLIVLAGCSASQKKPQNLKKLSWKQIKKRARGQTVNWMMWEGSPEVNAYINNYVVPQVKKRYDIDLKISSGQGNQIVSTLMTEQQADKKTSDIDLVWINGPTFYQLRQIHALYGPFVRKLPNAKYVNFNNPFIKYDFQQKVNGMEAPWGITQWVMIYNSEKVKHPPRNMQQLANYVKNHPGTFTIPNEFTGMTFLKNLMIEMTGKKKLHGKFNKQIYKKYSSRLWKYLNGIKQYFWKQGQTFPSTMAAMNQMFASGELNFSMTFGANSIDRKIADGTYPKASRAYLLQPGTIQNTNYIGIVKNSAHKAADMVVANFLLSPAAQYQKMRPGKMGSRTVLAVKKLPQKWQKKFYRIPESNHAPPRRILENNALQELRPQYMTHLYEDFRTNVIQQ